MKEYKQLTMDDRIEIYRLKQEGKSKRAIAKALGVHPSTIGRELKRNWNCGYHPRDAHRKTRGRRCGARRKYTKMTPEVISYIEAKIREDLSPEQIAGRMLNDPEGPGITISHERIYQHIWTDKHKGGDLYTHLRIAKNKKYRRRSNKKGNRGKIPNRVSIDKRPAIVEKRSRMGDWEGDTVMGKGNKQALVTLVDRKTKKTLIGKVERKTSNLVRDTVIDLLSQPGIKVHTVTFDNGTEFTAHEQMAKALDAKIYFAHPYSSWERGLNENTNGLIRQYFPKGSAFQSITDEDVAFVMDRLNNRPRKILNYKTPNELALKCRPRNDPQTVREANQTPYAATG